MTQCKDMKKMDYEKMYKEALERMRYVIVVPKNKEELQLIKETVFPELAESEDEKIRKQLIDAIKIGCSNRGISFTEEAANRFIVWLEKQKDQKPVEWNGPKEFISDTISERLKSLHLQPKQEWSEEDEKMRNKIIGHLSGYIYPNSLYGGDAKECIDWLKSLKSQPQSKPSR